MLETTEPTAPEFRSIALWWESRRLAFNTFICIPAIVLACFRTLMAAFGNSPQILVLLPFAAIVWLLLYYICLFPFLFWANILYAAGHLPMFFLRNLPADVAEQRASKMFGIVKLIGLGAHIVVLVFMAIHADPHRDPFDLSP